MSNFSATLVNKVTGEEREAMFLDDHFGRHHYGILFVGEEEAQDIHKVSEEWERKD